MADYWIKLYHELLDDPKMALLPDRLWRRTIELFLLAGKVNKNGLLPETAEVAWMLRCKSDEIQLDMDQIAMAGIIYKVDDGWMVAKFEERQAPVPDKVRKQKQRERDHKREYYGSEPITELSRIVTQITDTDTEADTEADTERDSARASESQQKPDAFDLIQAEIESVIGLPQGSEAVNAIQELVTIGAEACDIQEAADWYRSNGKTIHSARSLIGPVKTALMKRKQQSRAPTPEKFKKADILDPTERFKNSIANGYFANSFKGES
ncbi:MAG: hypothetical protein IH586_22320 [Anaerolineaceae bacterium]|nr:hypothetical protein [Anaerolineaceae bacterium]